MVQGEINLYFVRHGESVGNVTRSIPPNLEDVLTQKGKDQAEKLGRYLADIPFDRAYASDYLRTFETCSLILKHSKHLSADSIIRDVRLREQGAGIYEGKPYREALIDVIKSGKPVMEYVVPGGETREEVYKRMNNFLQEIFTDLTETSVKLGNQTILIVSHSFCLLRTMTLLHSATDKYLLVNWSDDCRKLMGNTSYMKVKLSKIGQDPHYNNNGAKWKLEFMEIQSKPHLGTEEGNEAEVRNAALKKFMAETGAHARVLSECAQS